MTILRTLRFLALAAFVAWGITSCISPPDYPDTPEISFKSITQETLVNSLGVPYDNVGITVSYKDGDGDLGLRGSDTLAPFNYYFADKVTLNPDAYNFLCQLQIRDANNVFQDIAFPANDPGLNSRYPRLTPDAQGDRKAPLKGDLTINLTVSKGFPPALRAGSVIRYRIRIKDRALHVSNEVLTDPITIK